MPHVSLRIAYSPLDGMETLDGFSYVLRFETLCFVVDGSVRGDGQRLQTVESSSRMFFHVYTGAYRQIIWLNLPPRFQLFFHFNARHASSLCFFLRQLFSPRLPPSPPRRRPRPRLMASQRREQQKIHNVSHWRPHQTWLRTGENELQPLNIASLSCVWWGARHPVEVMANRKENDYTLKTI